MAWGGIGRIVFARIVSWLIAIQALGALAAALVAIADIESIVLSGGPVSVAGLLIAAISFRRNRPAGLHLGLAAPTMAVFCFLIIYFLQWSPSTAQVPISMLLAAFALIHLFAGYLAFQESRRADGGGRKRRLQFSIASLLGLMVIVSVFFSLSKTAGELGAVIGGGVAYATFVVYFQRRFYKHRAEKDE